MARKTIGFLIDWANFYYQNTILRGIYDYVNRNNINLFCFEGGALDSPFEYEFKRNKLYNLISNKRIDGLIISTATISHYTDYNQIKIFFNKFKNIPKISISYEIENIPSILIDNNLGMYELLDHLIIYHKYRNFAFIRGTKYNKDADERYDIFSKTLLKNNIKIKNELIYNGNFSIQSGKDAVNYFLNQKQKIDIIVSSNDLMAIGAIEELNLKNIIVPEEIAVTGFDNFNVSKNFYPPITTVSQPIYNMGMTAVEQLVKIIDGKKIPEKQYIKTELIIRKSCGCNPYKKEITDNKKNITNMQKKEINKLKNKIIKSTYYSENIPSLLINDNLLRNFIDEFLNTIQKEKNINYFKKLNMIFTNQKFEIDDLNILINLIKQIRINIIPLITNLSHSKNAERICFITLEILSQQALKHDKFKTEETNQVEIILNLLRRELFVNLEIITQLQYLSKRLKDLNINECYICFFENLTFQDKSKLQFSYNNNLKQFYFQKSEIFNSNILIPDNIYKNIKCSSYIIESLKDYGYIIIELNQFKNPRLYESLCEIIGTSLHNAILFDKLTNQKNKIKNNFEKIRRAMGGFIETMAITIEVRDPYTAGHQRRVSDLARTIASKMKLDSNQVESVRMAGIIHDLGKIYIPAEILNKPGTLTDLEFNLIKSHPKVAYDILKNIEFPWPIAEIVYQHHEKLDGSGYPNGLKGDQITLEARILSVADVVEAISSHRPYRPALGINKALEKIKRGRGIIFDTEVVDVCLELFLKDGFKFRS